MHSGVNKDTSSPCFSPHHHLHQEAANLAVEVKLRGSSQQLLKNQELLPQFTKMNESSFLFNTTGCHAHMSCPQHR
jgi:hypothetical protein